jgi:malate dehydrogenase (oxaloacetate-decarboxylating)
MNEPKGPDERQPKQGWTLLRDPLLNQGTAFTADERRIQRLDGLLPAAETTLEQQAAAAYHRVMAQPGNLEKWEALRELLLDNETLFFRVARDHLTEILPLIYTPTIGDVAQKFSELWRPSRGVILHPGLRGRFKEILRRIPECIQIIVATDGERVLGLGDQGLGGMAISQGKVALYSLFGGVYPGATLPVCLDVGTNHEGLLEDPDYLGWRHPRLTGKDYDAFLDEFVEAVKEVFPKALLQWEDFGKTNARRVLERYRHQTLSFNDDIQGTAAVTLAGLLAALKEASRPLAAERVIIFGGGSAGLGIAERLMQYSVRQGGTAHAMAQRIYILDRRGLLTPDHPMHDPLQKELAKPREQLESWTVTDPDHITLEEVVRNLHPTILIGVSAHGGAFSEEIVREMAAHCQRPIIFPLSNPTSKSEAVPSELIRWTDGRCIIATGSPFAPVPFGERTYQIGQCNNLYIFPGVGMGCLIAEARQVTDSMLDRAAEILAQHSPALKDPTLALFPTLSHAIEIAREVSLAVAVQAQQDGVAPACELETLRQRLSHMVWTPAYASRLSLPPCG